MFLGEPHKTPCMHALQVTEALRERYFGKELEQCSHDNYCPAWATDAVDVTSQPGGDGESVLSLSHRIRGLFQVSVHDEGCKHALAIAASSTNMGQDGECCN